LALDNSDGHRSPRTPHTRLLPRSRLRTSLAASRLACCGAAAAAGELSRPRRPSGLRGHDPTRETAAEQRRGEAATSCLAAVSARAATPSGYQPRLMPPPPVARALQPTTAIRDRQLIAVHVPRRRLKRAATAQGCPPRSQHLRELLVVAEVKVGRDGSRVEAGRCRLETTSLKTTVFFPLAPRRRSTGRLGRGSPFRRADRMPGAATRCARTRI